MSPERLQLELRRRLSTSTIVVKRDPHWAVRHGKHPEALQIWDRGPIDGEWYCAFVLQRRGLPIEPSEYVIQKVQRTNDRIHGGRASYVEDIERQMRDVHGNQDQHALDQFDRNWAENECREKIMHEAGHGRMYATS